MPTCPSADPNATSAVASARAATWRALAAAAFVLLLALRVVYAFSLVVNSDEPQHLHVAWEWWQGRLPYRDVFDNHAPAFGFLYAPLLAALGERADIVPLMRLGVLPWYALTLWLCYRIGSALFERRIALAATAIAALDPTFFLKSVEFRPDVPWAAACLLAVVIAVAPEPVRWRWAKVGLASGFALALSIKTALFLVAGGTAGAVLLVPQWRASPRAALRTWLTGGAAWLAGFAAIPAFIAICFAAAGAADALAYCLFDHNLANDVGRWSHSSLPYRWLLPLLLVPPLIHAAELVRRHGAERRVAALRAWMFLTAAGYLVLRDGYQAFIDRQDLLPWVPMVSPLVVAAADRLIRHAARPPWRALAPRVLFGAAIAVEAGLVTALHPPWRNEAAHYAQTLANVLRFARPGDFVLDAKGNAIFRERPTYWDFENITLYRFARGVIREDVAGELARCRIAVVVGESWPSGLAHFLGRNYLPAGASTFVAGMRLDAMPAAGETSFSIAIPQRYALHALDGPFVGELDGSAYAGPRELGAGTHRLAAAQAGPIVLEWAGGEASAACTLPDFATARAGLRAGPERAAEAGIP